MMRDYSPRRERRPFTASPPKGFGGDQAICCVTLSSGTTGRPKAIALTIKAFQQWIMNYYSTLGLGTWDRLLLLIGLTSSWGFSLAAHALFAGRTLLFAATARDSLQMIAVYSVDAVAATSQQLRELAREQERAPVPCASLRTVLTGGGLLSRALIAQARAILCSSIVNLYGSSEAGGTAFANTDQLAAVGGASGFVAPWAEVEIVNDHGHVLPADHDGILRIRATCQGAPYPPDRAGANLDFRDGWFYPGDRGRITSDGMMILSGRTSEIINAGGLKLAPEVVEEIVRAHPAVVDAAAFGKMGEGGIEEVLVAVVVRTPVADQQLIDWSAERGIPVARVFIVETLPKTPSGKIHRDQLKRQLLT
jgi:acyl-coenzyme A synthetase/AMP-(fatty) acid ligase